MRNLNFKNFLNSKIVLSIIYIKQNQNNSKISNIVNFNENYTMYK